MGEPPPSWPPRVSDREFPDAPDREFPRGDREFPASSRSPWDDREDAAGPRVSPATPDRELVPTTAGEGDSLRVPAFISPLREWRFVRDATTTADHIDYAITGAYSVNGEGWWRKANIVYAHTIVPVGILLCDAIKFVFFERLSRFLIAIPTVLALAWLLNHIPVTAWLIPDGWDVTTWWQPDPATTVEVPVEAPVGEG